MCAVESPASEVLNTDWDISTADPTSGWRVDFWVYGFLKTRLPPACFCWPINTDYIYKYLQVVFCQNAVF